MSNELAERPVVKTVRNLLSENREQFAKLLPKIVPAERFLATIVACVQENHDLQECTVPSLVRCILQCAQLGLTPGPRRLVYLVPFNNNKTKRKEAQLIVGYQGLLQLCRNSGQIAAVDAQPVYDGDMFEYTIGTDPSIKHVPKSEWRRKIKAEKEQAPGKYGFMAPESWSHITDFYAFAKLSNGEKKVVVLTREEVDYCRDRFSKAAKSGPWVDDYPAMGCKTALRELCNLLPSSEERHDLSKAVTLDKQAEADIPQTLDVPFEIKGMEEPSESPRESAEPKTPRLPDFGDNGGKHVDDPTVPVEGRSSLVWYLKVVGENLDKKGCERFRDQNLALIQAIEIEVARRKQAEEAVKPAENRTETGQGDVQTPEPEETTGREPDKATESELIGDDRWGAVLKYMQSKKPLSAIRDIVKTRMQVKLLSNLEPHQRGEFMATYETEARTQGLTVEWPMV